MTDFVTNLLGQVIEYASSPDSGYWEKAIVVGIGHGKDRVVAVIEVVDDDRYQKVGAMRVIDLSYSKVRAIKRCARCWVWDHHSQMVREGLAEDLVGSLERADLSGWAHREGKGCRKS